MTARDSHAIARAHALRQSDHVYAMIFQAIYLAELNARDGLSPAGCAAMVRAQRDIMDAIGVE